jgi:hypothetical protein
MARLLGSSLELSGLGDSVVLMLKPGASVWRHCAMPASREREQAFARALLQHSGGFGNGVAIPRRGEALARMRRARAAQNTPSGIWTLGLVPEAARFVAFDESEAVAGTRLLLMSDGFAAIADDYAQLSQDDLLARALKLGLADLLAWLRRIERIEDPAAERWPRFKRSDDATAILAEIVP